MSSNSGTSTQHISLPKGGGALQGIGEKFSPDLHTGTGNFSVPIALPPGRNGFQPQLSLAYSTGNGNGPFGLDGSQHPRGRAQDFTWRPPLRRCHRYLILSGSEDLVPISSEPDSPTRYRPRTEGLFARIDHYHGGASDFWEVASRDGLVSRYGTRRPADAPGDWRDPAVVANPDQNRRSQVFAWKLTQTTDPFGNRIEYSYTRDLSQVEGPHQWDQVYLSEIRYVDYGDPDKPQFVAHVRLEYEPRPDPFSDYRAGFEIRTKRRCTAIRVSIQPTAEAGVEILARTYRLVYLDRRDLPVEQMPRNGVSLLSEVRVEGKDGDRTEPLPPLEFTYTAFEPEKRRFRSFTGPNNSLPEESLGNPDYALVDLFRDGLLDVVKMNGSVRFWRNRGEGQFDRPRTMPEAPASPHLGEMGVQFFDANGDGSTDLLITDGTRGGYYPLSSRGGWDRRSFVAYQKVPSFTLEDPDVKLLDLDGDGAHDAVRTGVDFELFYNDRDTGWTTSRSGRARAAPTSPTSSSATLASSWRT